MATEADEVSNRVLNVLQGELDVSRAELAPDATWLTLGADSLTRVEVAMALEDAFDVVVEEDEFFADDTTVVEISAIVRTKLNAKGTP